MNNSTHQVPRKVISQLQLKYDEYLDFAMSFVSAGLQLQEEFDVDLGTNTYKQNNRIEFLNNSETVY